MYCNTAKYYSTFADIIFILHLKRCAMQIFALFTSQSQPQEEPTMLLYLFVVVLPRSVFMTHPLSDMWLMSLICNQ